MGAARTPAAHVEDHITGRDPFHDQPQDLARAIGAQGSFDHGAHDDGYWRRVLPEALRFIGDRL